jgi:hypothetical protein
MRTLVLGFVTALLVSPAAAQEVDARWSGWLGCWELITDHERGDAPVPAAAAIDRARGFDRPLPRDAGDADSRVCVTPGGDGVTMTTYHGEAIVLEQAVSADGRAHAVGGLCPGTRRVEWANGRAHLLSHAEFVCADAPPHTGSALALITADGTWLDLETVRTGGREALRVRHYRRFDPAGPAARPVMGAPLTLADVQYLSARLPAPIVEAAIVESRATLPVGAREVVGLADSGVPERVIDLIVALAYPETFVVERQLPPAPASFNPGSLSSADAWRYYAPMGFSMPGFFADPDFYFFRSTPGVLIIDGGGWTGGGGGGGVGAAPPPASVGTGVPRVVNDLGYTRVREREVDSPTPQRRPMTTNPGGTMAGSTTATTSSGSSAGDGGGGGSATASPGGYSSGGGSDTGRTAVPR